MRVAVERRGKCEGRQPSDRRSAQHSLVAGLQRLHGNASQAAGCEAGRGEGAYEGHMQQHKAPVKSRPVSVHHIVHY